MYIIAGLGNPGRRYQGTRHNIGFITVDTLAEKYGIKINKIKYKALVGEGNISGQKVLLVKPQTFMNLSGESIREVMAYYDEPAEHLLVILDDVDIEMGRIRMKQKGSAGTHNGMRSIVCQLQNEDFPRLKVGIGGDEERQRRVGLASYVLGGFGEDERRLMTEAVEKAVEAVECLLENGIDYAMNLYNRKTPTEGKQKEDE